MIMFGDFRQLAPVKDTALYKSSNDDDKNKRDKEGKKKAQKNCSFLVFRKLLEHMGNHDRDRGKCGQKITVIGQRNEQDNKHYPNPE